MPLVLQIHTSLLHQNMCITLATPQNFSKQRLKSFGNTGDVTAALSLNSEVQ